MVVLFILPAMLNLVLGSAHVLTAWSRQGLNLYVVPPIVLLMLFTTPVDWKKGQFVLGWKDASAHTPWDIMILVTAAAAVVEVLVEFQFVEVAGQAVAGLGLGSGTLPFVASYVVAASTNLISGVAATSFFRWHLHSRGRAGGIQPDIDGCTDSEYGRRHRFSVGRSRVWNRVRHRPDRDEANGADRAGRDGPVCLYHDGRSYHHRALHVIGHRFRAD